MLDTRSSYCYVTWRSVELGIIHLGLESTGLQTNAGQCKNPQYQCIAPDVGYAASKTSFKRAAVAHSMQRRMQPFDTSRTALQT